MNQRIGQMVKQLGTLKAAAEIAGISPEQLGRYRDGVSQPTFTPIAKLAQATGVSLEWVWSGECETGPLEMEGIKHDGDKTRVDLLPVDALVAVARVLTFGSAKYGDRNWERGLHYGRVFGAALRHLFAWWQREDSDPETGLPHLAHAACCVLFLLSFHLRRMPAFDDRPEVKGG